MKHLKDVSPAPYINMTAGNISSSKHAGPESERFKFFQGDQSIFTKEFEDDLQTSKLYGDQSSSMLLMLNKSDDDRKEDDEADAISNPKIAQLIIVNKCLDEVATDLASPQRAVLLDLLERLTTEAKEIKDNYKILLKCMELQGKIIRDLGDYSRTVSIFKMMRIYCNISKLPDKKLAVYKLLVDTYIQMREYVHALVFAKKMLRLAWRENDPDFEITAYDKIGLIYYYTGDLHQAEYFHEKAYSNAREPKNSQIRKAGEAPRLKNKKSFSSSYQQNNYETDSEDEFELGMFSNGYASQRRFDQQALQAKSSSLPSLKNRIPVPRIVNDYIKHRMELGRVDVSVEKKLTFMEGEQDPKMIYNQMSLNRNLKNFMIQQYVNHAYWTGTQDQLSQIKFYHLHRNLKNHLNFIVRIKRQIKQQRRLFKLENILGNEQLANNNNNTQVDTTMVGSQVQTQGLLALNNSNNGQNVDNKTTLQRQKSKINQNIIDKTHNSINYSQLDFLSSIKKSSRSSLHNLANPKNNTNNMTASVAVLSSKKSSVPSLPQISQQKIHAFTVHHNTRPSVHLADGYPKF